LGGKKTWLTREAGKRGMGWDNQGDSRCRDILAESQKVGRSVTFLEPILLRFVVLLALVLFWFGTERRHVLVYNVPSQRYESGRSSRPVSKSLLASFFPSSAKGFLLLLLLQRRLLVVSRGPGVVFLCSNPVSFGVLFHDIVCE
jgi:hypothetical protein